MKTWVWWEPPWLVGCGTWRACVSKTQYALFRYLRNGWLCSSISGELPSGGSDEQLEHIRAASEALMKRRSRTGVPLERSPHADGLELLESYPNLAAWLTDPTFEDGTDRRAGWLSVTAENGLFSLLAKDAGEAAQLRIQAPTLSALFIMFEHALCDPAAPWKHDSGAFQGRKGKGKK